MPKPAIALWMVSASVHGLSYGRQNVLRVALKILPGHETEQELNIFEAEELSVDPGSTRVNVSIDGDVSIMEAPLHFRRAPHTRHCYPGEYSLSFGSWRGSPRLS